MSIRSRTRLLVCWLAAAGCLTSSPAHSHFIDPASDSFAKVKDDKRLETYIEALTGSGESTTGRLYDFAVDVCPVSKDGGRNTLRLKIHVLQDRGVSHGGTFPTYVLTSKAQDHAFLLTGKVHAEPQIYLADPLVCTPGQCVLSAKTGFTDICLADGFGNRAENADGLRQDIWTHLFRLLGL